MAFEVPRDLLAVAVSDDDLRRAPKPRIVNVVATFNFSNPSLNLEALTLRLPGAGFNPKRFAVGKMRWPRPMALVFPNGRAVCPGSRSVMDARLAALGFTSILLRSGELAEYSRFRVENIVMSVSVPFEIDMGAMLDDWSSHAEYVPSRFPGASFRFGCGPGTIVFNVFVTGRVVITRSRNENDSMRAWLWFYEHVLARYKLGSAAGTTSSATYHRASERRRNTLALDCAGILSRHIRRRDGSMARSVAYSTHVGTTPRTSRVYAPATVRVAAAQAAPASGSALVDRGSYFLGHAAACPYVCAPPERATDDWYGAYVRLGDAELAQRLLDEHARAGCASMTRELHVEQLERALGAGRLRALHGRDAPLTGHAFACPFLRDDARLERALTRLELALGDDEAALAERVELLDEHRRTGCFRGSVFASDDEREHTAVALLAQLQAFMDSSSSAAALTTAAPPPPPSTERALDVDEVVDFEAQFRVALLRRHADPDLPGDASDDDTDVVTGERLPRFRFSLDDVRVAA
jgi:TATA-box binding protein (TBP) (component of TFIID and TFIIIB)